MVSNLTVPALAFFQCPIPKKNSKALLRAEACLGIGCDNKQRRRLLSHDKRKQYTADPQEVLGGTELPNGCRRAQPDLAGSLVHKLEGHSDVVWSACVTPDGVHVITVGLTAGELVREVFLASLWSSAMEAGTATMT